MILKISKTIACSMPIALLLLLLCTSVMAQHPTLAGFQRQVQLRVARDQAARIGLRNVPRTISGEVDQKEHNRLMQRASDVDDENVAWLRKQVPKIGVPDPSVLGKKCTDGFFLLMLHADRDRELQRKCIGLMKKAPDQWPASYVELLERRASNPPPRKIKLSQPDQTKEDDGEDEPSASAGLLPPFSAFHPTKLNRSCFLKNKMARRNCATT